MCGDLGARQPGRAEAQMRGGSGVRRQSGRAPAKKGRTRTASGPCEEAGGRGIASSRREGG